MPCLVCHSFAQCWNVNHNDKQTPIKETTWGPLKCGRACAHTHTHTPHTDTHANLYWVDNLVKARRGLVKSQGTLKETCSSVVNVRHLCWSTNTNTAQLTWFNESKVKNTHQTTIEAEWSVNKYFILDVISLLCAVKELYNVPCPEARGIW